MVRNTPSKRARRVETKGVSGAASGFEMGNQARRAMQQASCSPSTVTLSGTGGFGGTYDEVAHQIQFDPR